MDATGPILQPALRLLGLGEERHFGLTTAERLTRQFARAGVSRVDTAPHTGPMILARADAVIDAPLIAVLKDRPGLLLLSEDAAVPLAVHTPPHLISEAMARFVRHPGESRDPPLNMDRPSTPFEETPPSGLGAGFWKALRKRETPYALIATPANREAVEWRMFMGTYKGATDVVTKYLWPVPAFHATRWLAPRGITPNQVTMVAALLTVAAFLLFFCGHYLPGLAAAWAMTFLDTVDGKLARTTLTSSKWGDIFDHGIDLVHPPFWYAAWAMGLGNLAFTSTQFWWLMVAILGGYVAQRALEGIAIAWLKLEIHIWRPIDTFFRLITARRNPNLILLTTFAVLGLADVGLIAVAVWTVICLVLHGMQLMMAVSARRSGPLTSWMTRQP